MNVTNASGRNLGVLTPRVVTTHVPGVRFTPGGIRQGATGHNVTFIHPKGNEASPIGGAGVLIELVQAPADVIAALSPDKK